MNRASRIAEGHAFPSTTRYSPETERRMLPFHLINSAKLYSKKASSKLEKRVAATKSDTRLLSAHALHASRHLEGGKGGRPPRGISSFPFFPFLFSFFARLFLYLLFLFLFLA